MLNNWNDITIELYQELVGIKKSSETLTTTELYIEIISFLEGISPSDPVFDDMSAEELMSKIKNTSWVWGLPEGRIKSWNDYSPKPLESLTFGEFIDIESFQADKEENLHKIAALLWRKTKINEWDNLVYEPYEYDLFNRSEEFKNAPVSSVYPIIGLYEKWREDFFKNYAELFMSEEEQKQLEEIQKEEEEEDTGNYSRTEQKKQEILEERQKKWSWESLIWGLTQEDMTKIISLLELPVLLVFNMLSMKKSLEE